MFESDEGIQILQKNRAYIAFVSASGISLSLGVTCSNGYERQTKETIMSYSMKKVLVADSSKFDAVHSTYFADLSDFDTVVTDQGIPDKYRAFCEENGIELITV